MPDLSLFKPPAAPNERLIAAVDLAELRRNPRVIEGAVTSSWFPRPIWPIIATSGALLAIGVASVVQEVVR